MIVEVNTDTIDPHSEDERLVWVLATLVDDDKGLVDIDAINPSTMTTQDAYEVAEEVTREFLTEADSDWDDGRDWCIGEAAGYLADLEMMPEVRKAALRGIVAGANAAGLHDLFHNERDLADQVAEALNTAL